MIYIPSHPHHTSIIITHFPTHPDGYPPFFAHKQCGKPTMNGRRSFS